MLYLSRNGEYVEKQRDTVPDARPRPRGAVSAAFLIGYGVFRFAVEYTREPDSYLGLLAFDLSMGQWLSAPMVIAGVALMAWAYRQPSAGNATADKRR